MSKCCKYHNNMVFIDTDLTRCGMAGMGTPIVCCNKCSQNGWFIEQKGVLPFYYATDVDAREDREQWELFNVNN